MKKQRRGLNRHNMLQDGKKKKNILYICMIHEKTNFEKKKKKKKEITGVRTHIHENRRLLIYILKNERSTCCAKESLENYT